MKSRAKPEVNTIVDHICREALRFFPFKLQIKEVSVMDICSGPHYLMSIICHFTHKHYTKKVMTHKTPGSWEENI